MESTLNLPMTTLRAVSGRLEQLAEEFLVWAAEYRQYSAYTVYGYRRDLATLLGYLQTSDLPAEPEAVTRDVLIAYAESFRGAKRATVHRRIASVASFFRWARDHGKTGADPAQKIPLPRSEKRLPRFPSDEEVRRLMDACYWPWQRTAIILLVCTGVRRGELVGLRLQDVDLGQKRILVHGKGSKERRIGLAAIAMEAVETYLRYREPRITTDAFLVSHVGVPVQVHTLYKLVKDLVRETGAQQALSPHWLRHGFATSALRRGTDIRTLQALMGHESITTTAIYLEVDDASQRAAVEAVAGLLR